MRLKKAKAFLFVLLLFVFLLSFAFATIVFEKQETTLSWNKPIARGFTVSIPRGTTTIGEDAIVTEYSNVGGE